MRIRTCLYFYHSSLLSFVSWHPSGCRKNKLAWSTTFPTAAPVESELVVLYRWCMGRVPCGKSSFSNYFYKPHRPESTDGIEVLTAKSSVAVQKSASALNDISICVWNLNILLLVRLNMLLETTLHFYALSVKIDRFTQPWIRLIKQYESILFSRESSSYKHVTNA